MTSWIRDWVNDKLVYEPKNPYIYLLPLEENLLSLYLSIIAPSKLCIFVTWYRKEYFFPKRNKLQTYIYIYVSSSFIMSTVFFVLSVIVLGYESIMCSLRLHDLIIANTWRNVIVYIISHWFFCFNNLETESFKFETEECIFPPANYKIVTFCLHIANQR